MELNDYSLSMVARVTGVDMQTTGKTTLFTVPNGKTFIPFAVLVHQPDDSLAGLTDVDIGSGASCDTWRQTVDLSSMTTADTDFMWITGSDVTKYTESGEGAEFGININSGATAAATATIDVYGILL